MAAPALPAAPPRRRGLLSTTIGKKLVVAVTGLGWIGFVVAHMVGNLKFFLGPESGADQTPAINVYSEWLRDLGTPAAPRTVVLWILRFGLIVMFTAHVVLVVILSKRSHDSRPVRYARTGKVQANRASLMMRWGGLTLFLFIFFHLAQLTWGVTPDIRYVRGDAYTNLHNVFWHRPWMGAIYLLAMVALAGHLYHGFWSTMQTLGFNRARFDPLFRRIALGIAGVTVAGNVAIILGATLITRPGY